MTKVLLISTVGLKYDGITNVILSNLEAMDKTNLELFVVETITSEKAIKEKFKSLGCKIITLPDRRKYPVRYFWKLFRFIRKNKIDVVHANGNSATLAIEMLAAKLGNCHNRIAHSHNTKADYAKLDKLLRPLFEATYTQAVACSNDAGKWLFKDRPFTVIKNGRNLSKYQYNDQIRKVMRSELNLRSENLAIGHVGGFVRQKNHEFLLNVFKAILDRNKNAQLFLIGDGPLRQDIERQANDLGISENVTFIGNVDNVNDYLQAMDVMVMPSLFEGLPLALLEWQLCGLPVVMSDQITSEAIISDKVELLSLADQFIEWAKLVIEISRNIDRKNNSNLAIKNAKFEKLDIKESSKILRELYFKSNV